MNRIQSLFSVALASIALGSVACAAPQADGADGEHAGATSQASTREDGASDLVAAPAPREENVTCKTITGNHSVTIPQCKKLLNAQGCKPGAVTGGELGCTTAGDPAAPSDVPSDLSAAPAPREENVTCKTITGNHNVTIPQCKKLLNAQGCKPGAVTGGELGCTTAGDPVAPDGNPDDFSAAPERPAPLTCKTITGNHSVTQAQCEDLLRKQGCEPGAVVGGEQTCTTK